MKVLLLDDTMGNPKIVTQLLQDLDSVSAIVVAQSLSETAWHRGVDVIILGGRWLRLAKQVRGLQSRAYIIGRSPWLGEEVKDFYPWGNELRGPLLTPDQLLRGRKKLEEDFQSS